MQTMTKALAWHLKNWTMSKQFEKLRRNINNFKPIASNCTKYKSNPLQDIDVTLLKKERCYKNLKNYKKALPYFNRLFQIKQNATLNAENDRSIAVTLFKIGTCYINLDNYHEALTYT